MNRPRDFIIENDVLIKYVGPGGNVEIPDGVRRIAGIAFYCNTDVTGVLIPKSVEEIECGAFASCSSMKRIEFDLDRSHGLKIGTRRELWRNKDGEAVYKGFEPGYDPERDPDPIYSSGIYLGNNPSSHTFLFCNDLEAVNVSDIAAWCGTEFFSRSVLGIWDNPLLNAKKLYLYGNLVTDLVIPEGVEVIKYGAFAACHFIESVTIPASVKRIESVAFAACVALKTVTIPGGIESVADSAFHECHILETLIIKGKISPENFGSAFEERENLKKVYIDDVPDGPGDSPDEKRYTLPNVPDGYELFIDGRPVEKSRIRVCDTYEREVVYDPIDDTEYFGPGLMQKLCRLYAKWCDWKLKRKNKKHRRELDPYEDWLDKFDETDETFYEDETNETQGGEQ